MLKLHNIFQNGVVLQRGAGTKIYGSSNPEDTILIKFLDVEYLTYANKNGFWEAKFQNLKATKEGNSLTIINKLSGEEITIVDVIIGDIWLAAGQSNMQLTMARTKTMFPDEVKDAKNLKDRQIIRQFTVPEKFDFSSELSDFETPAKWQSVSAKTIEDFSAVGYFFAKELTAHLDIPIGIIVCAIGGTPITAWLPYNAAKQFKGVKEETAKLDKKYIDSVLEKDAKKQEKYYREINAADLGIQNSWEKTNFDDSSWENWQLSEPFTGDMKKTGALWFRKTFTVSKAEIGKAAYLYLGTAIDEDFIYINGKQIGHTGYRYPPRNYKIDKLPSRKCTIAIRLLNHYGKAHFTEGKPHFLVTDSATLSLESGWKMKRGCYFKKMPETTFFAYKPTGLFNAMFAPLEHFNLKGILWYQGESDCADAENYLKKFCHLINAWRKKLGKNANELPFLFAQLPYQFYNENEDWDALRAEQFKALKIKNTGMIFTQDIGEYNDLHPQNKYLIAYRFSRLARKLAYDEKIVQTPFELTGYIDD